jgi:hypothetical protein
MATSRVLFEDRLDWVSNYNPLKERIMLVLMENDIWEYTNVVMVPPADPKDLGAHTLKDMKARRIILDGVKDHLIFYLSGKKSANSMWDALKSLFQRKNEIRIMVSREKFRDTKMT